MRGITISYTYSGDEAAWQAGTGAFIGAVVAEPGGAGGFRYPVAVGGAGTRRVRWGRWDSAETLAHVQSQDYFKTFAGKVKEFAGGAPSATGHDIAAKTGGW